MINYSIPLKAFELLSDINLEEKLETENKAEIGFLIERDRLYPVAFHEKHLDFPVISEKKQLAHWSIANIKHN